MNSCVAAFKKKTTNRRIPHSLSFIVGNLLVYHCRLHLYYKLKLSEHVDVCVCSYGRGRNRSWLSGRWRFKIWQSFKDFILGLFLVFAPVRTPGANFYLPRDWKIFRLCFHLQQFQGSFQEIWQSKLVSQESVRICWIKSYL